MDMPSGQGLAGLRVCLALLWAAVWLSVEAFLFAGHFREFFVGSKTPRGSESRAVTWQ